MTALFSTRCPACRGLVEWQGDYRKAPPCPDCGPLKRSKYGNRRTTVDGITFDSAKEARRWRELQARCKADEICEVERQPRFECRVKGVMVCVVVPDFRYFDLISQEDVVEDVKSPATRKNRVYRLKAKLLLACHGIQVREV